MSFASSGADGLSRLRSRLRFDNSRDAGLELWQRLALRGAGDLVASQTVANVVLARDQVQPHVRLLLHAESEFYNKAPSHDTGHGTGATGNTGAESETSSCVHDFIRLRCGSFMGLPVRGREPGLLVCLAPWLASSRLKQWSGASSRVPHAWHAHTHVIERPLRGCVGRKLRTVFPSALRKVSSWAGRI